MRPYHQLSNQRWEIIIWRKFEALAIGAADAINEAGVIISQYLEVTHAMNTNGSPDDQVSFIANRAYEVVAIRGETRSCILQGHTRSGYAEARSLLGR